MTDTCSREVFGQAVLDAVEFDEQAIARAIHEADLGDCVTGLDKRDGEVSEAEIQDELMAELRGECRLVAQFIYGDYADGGDCDGAEPTEEMLA